MTQPPALTDAPQNADYVTALLSRIEELERALEHINIVASRNGRTFDDAVRDFPYIADHARAALAKDKP